jgi:hypothetical protein
LHSSFLALALSGYLTAFVGWWWVVGVDDSERTRNTAARGAQEPLNLDDLHNSRRVR